ncbi:hypothetical protein [Fusobacterium animalis]|uniref:Helix-turn-helix type 11 domain-containing protein n=1 Tax=Fusobacterium animalis TaxID=76859 RepID=A0A0M4RWW0_9FUSO|nr:hypothetical protein [Fusobacterium animalis]ALF17434.1 hypothetical protein RN98_04365 [Fusobacterium animalis]
MDNLTYNAADVAKMLNRSKSTAYRRIYEMNLEHCKKNKLNIDTMGSGRVSKELFHKYYPGIKI